MVENVTLLHNSASVVIEIDLNLLATVNARLYLRIGSLPNSTINIGMHLVLFSIGSIPNSTVNIGIDSTLH